MIYAAGGERRDDVDFNAPGRSGHLVRPLLDGRKFSTEIACVVYNRKHIHVALK